MKPRAIKAYGTKRYAVIEVRRRLREYAKATRRWASDDSKRWTIEHDWTTAHGTAMGVVHGFHAIGALTGAQYARACRRLERISAKNVRRKPCPFEPHRAGPVVCSFGDELAGKAPPTFGPAAEGRAS